MLSQNFITTELQFLNINFQYNVLRSHWQFSVRYEIKAASTPRGERAERLFSAHRNLLLERTGTANLLIFLQNPLRYLGGPNPMELGRRT
ncbi:hypothetical protein CDAR_14251 [Caerostris darwini]|uniref:Uncharacterized protein n=1 Tax=Caerostris darwini TaxID=1538125 RepID=A0AAV4QAC9_9ARAC|nr:hypothetical protein CDAR_14251 [Caerostris darwini]